MLATVGLATVRSVVISRKLSKISPQLLLNTMEKLVPLILSPHSDSPQSLWKYFAFGQRHVQILINTVCMLFHVGVRRQLLYTVRPS